jgi:hypothetical protein
MRSIQWGKIYGIGDSRQGSLLISYVSTNTSTSTSNSKNYATTTAATSNPSAALLTIPPQNFLPSREPHPI